MSAPNVYVVKSTCGFYSRGACHDYSTDQKNAFRFHREVAIGGKWGTWSPLQHAQAHARECSKSSGAKLGRFRAVRLVKRAKAVA